MKSSNSSWIRADFWTVAFLVTAIHIGIGYLFIRGENPAPPLDLPKRVAVATVQLRSPSPPPAAPVSTAPPPAKPKPCPPPPPPEPKKSAPPPPKPKQATPPPPTSPVVKSKKSDPPPPTSPKKSPPPSSTDGAQAKERQKRLQEAQERIAKIGKREESSERNSALSSRVPTLEIEKGERPLEGKEGRYCDELAQRLRLMLRLPEYGEVRLVITLGRNGRVEEVKVIETQSDRNRSYVVDRLMGATFPPFGTLFPHRERESFPVTLSNEI